MDVFRNSQALFCLFEPPPEVAASPFDLRLGVTGLDFAVMGMHFKLGLYEHQSAGAIQGLISLLAENPQLLDDVEALEHVRVVIYEPAFGIIGDPAKRDPRTRQSADHSMVYIVATLLRKAYEEGEASWLGLMLLPRDYDDESLFHPLTRRLMEKIRFEHGGDEYDIRYPDGIPTRVDLLHAQHGSFTSGLVLYPLGHARSEQVAEFGEVVATKFQRLAGLGVTDPRALQRRLLHLSDVSADEFQDLYNFSLDACSVF